MSAIFLYGSLRDVALLELVLGRDVARDELSDGILANAEVRWNTDVPFPMILLGQGEGAVGLVLNSASEEDRARLAYFEGPFQYPLAPATLEDGRAVELFVPSQAAGSPGDLWDFAAWHEAHGVYTHHLAREVMGYFGQRSADEVAAMWGPITARAQAKTRAMSAAFTGREMRGRVDVIARRRAYANFFALDEFDVSYERFDGTMSEPVNRAVFIGMDAAIVLPYDPVRDRVLLVEQFRVGPLGRGDPTVWHLEPIAGIVDAYETPEQAARREAREEAGLEVSEVELIASTYPSTGASSEYFHIFVALCELPDEAIGTAGLVEEGEDIRSHLLTFSELMDLLETQRVSDTPLVIAGYWLAHHRARLRAAQGKGA